MGHCRCSITALATRTGRGSSAQKKMIRASGMHEMWAMSPEQARMVMAAAPAVLRSALTAINDQYGSLANYRPQALHISDGDLEKLEDRLLTP